MRKASTSRRCLGSKNVAATCAAAYEEYARSPVEKAKGADIMKFAVDI